MPFCSFTVVLSLQFRTLSLFCFCFVLLGLRSTCWHKVWPPPMLALLFHNLAIFENLPSAPKLPDRRSTTYDSCVTASQINTIFWWNNLNHISQSSPVDRVFLSSSQAVRCSWKPWKKSSKEVDLELRLYCQTAISKVKDELSLSVQCNLWYLSCRISIDCA